jgi:hypothetical protein
MSIVLDGTTGITTPGMSNSGSDAITGNQTVAGRSTFATTIGVGNATPSTSGAGITFPATQSASSDANTLDDYEEGTWTPTITDISGSTIGITYSVRVGTYTKVGNTVTIQGYFAFSNKGSLSGLTKMAGLPFANINATNSFAAPVYGIFNNTTGITAYFIVGDFAPSSTQMPLYYPTGTGQAALTFSMLTNTFGMEWNYSYQTST